jgi:hypothetical protein
MTLLYVFFVIESSSLYRDTPKSEQGCGDKTIKRKIYLNIDKLELCQNLKLLILFGLFS